MSQFLVEATTHSLKQRNTTRYMRLHDPKPTQTFSETTTNTPTETLPVPAHQPTNPPNQPTQSQMSPPKAPPPRPHTHTHTRAHQTFTSSLLALQTIIEDQQNCPNASPQDYSTFTRQALSQLSKTIDSIRELPIDTDAQLRDKAKIVQQTASGYLVNRGIQREVLRQEQQQQQQQQQQRKQKEWEIRVTGSDIGKGGNERNEESNGKAGMREAAKRPLRELKDMVKRAIAVVEGRQQRGKRRTRGGPH
ncbi:hypothetical protein LTS18_009801 [Coniosporium uncinatum]|uniref:Uncharacterized protein n=1 Tax=Coniosporium uncinatum TaxID=93489 RepID=A0ACC3D9T9_9PEZI|nr:hypothetical protein LTS18_009801 [Coniosporium uncinatum]